MSWPLSLASAARALARHAQSPPFSAWQHVHNRGLARVAFAPSIDSRLKTCGLFSLRDCIYRPSLRTSSCSSRYPHLSPPRLARPCFTHSRMSGASVPAPTDTPADKFRLPTSVKPAHYDLTVRTDLEKLVFDGYVTVQ